MKKIHFGKIKLWALTAGAEQRDTRAGDAAPVSQMRYYI
jgi:hypothetical protein